MPTSTEDIAITPTFMLGIDTYHHIRALALKDEQLWLKPNMILGLRPRLEGRGYEHYFR
jgi:hypothetical protein